MFKADISFTSLAASNECTKSFKFDKVKFEVTIRIRQAINKKEIETIEEKNMVVEQIFVPFNEYLLAKNQSEADK